MNESTVWVFPSQTTCSGPLILPVALPWIHSSLSMSVSHAEGNGTYPKLGTVRFFYSVRFCRDQTLKSHNTTRKHFLPAVTRTILKSLKELTGRWNTSRQSPAHTFSDTQNEVTLDYFSQHLLWREATLTATWENSVYNRLSNTEKHLWFLWTVEQRLIVIICYCK